MELEALGEWRRAQPVQQEAALQEGQLYRIDGMVVRAKRDEDERFTLWKWNGRGGNDAGTCTGFEIGEFGGLYERVWDYMSENALVVSGLPRFTVRDLVPVTTKEAMAGGTSMTVEEFAERLPDLYASVRNELDRNDVGLGKA